MAERARMGMGWRLRAAIEGVGGTGATVNLSLLALLLGGYLPWRLGIEFLDPLVIVSCVLAGPVLVSATAARGLETKGGEDGLAARRRWALALALGGLMYQSLVLAGGLAVVNATHWYGGLLLTPWPVLVAALLLGFAASAFTAGAGAWLAARRYTPAEVRIRLRGVLLAVLLTGVLRSVVVPSTVREWVAPAATTWGVAGLALAGAVALAAGAEWCLRRSGGAMLG